MLDRRSAGPCNGGIAGRRRYWPEDLTALDSRGDTAARGRLRGGLDDERPLGARVGLRCRGEAARSGTGARAVSCLRVQPPTRRRPGQGQLHPKCSRHTSILPGADRPIHSSPRQGSRGRVLHMNAPSRLIQATPWPIRASAAYSPTATSRMPESSRNACATPPSC